MSIQINGQRRVEREHVQRRNRVTCGRMLDWVERQGRVAMAESNVFRVIHRTTVIDA